MIFNWSEEFDYGDVYTLDLFDVKIVTSQKKLWVILDKKLGFPKFVILNSNGSFPASSGEELTVEINVTNIPRI